MKQESKFEFLVAAFIHDLKNQLQSLSGQQDILINELPAEYQQKLVPMLRQTNQIKEDTLRQRLANSTNVNKVFAKQTLKTKLFLLGDGTKVTVQEYATRMKLSAECAQNELINIALDSECPRKQFKLSNGTTVTLDEVMKIAGITNTAAKYRLNISNDPKKVLKKSIRLKRQSLVPNCHHMFQCDRTGSIMKIGI